jgi:hypothetical protein
MKSVGFVVGLASLRVVNGWLSGMSVDVFMERTVLMILMVYAIIGIRAWHATRGNSSRRGRSSGLSVSRSGPTWRPIPMPERNQERPVPDGGFSVPDGLQAGLGAAAAAQRNARAARRATMP